MGIPEFQSYMIFRNYRYWVLLSLFASGLCGQPEDEKEPKTFLFGLIKFDTESTYEKGHWFDKWFHAREFSEPVSLIPVELRYGIGFNGKTSGSLSQFNDKSAIDDPGKVHYDEDVDPIDQKFKNLWGSSFEFDLGLINIPHLIFKTSYLNVMTGLTLRTSKLFYAAEVPHDSWATTNSNWGTKKYFSPKVRELLITNHFQYQPFNYWYLNFRYSYGFAYAGFYASDRETWEDTPTGTGTSMATSAGIRFILDRGKKNRFSVGLDLRYSYTKIHTIYDPSELTPINRFDLSNYGLYLTLATFYGGRLSKGDEGKQMYYRKDYFGAKKKFERFLSDYPSHANRYKAEEYLELCNYKIPYVVMEEGMVFDDEKKLDKALAKYLNARSLAKEDTLIINTLDHRLDQIANLWMLEAEETLSENKYDEAFNLVMKVAKFSERGKKEIRRFKSYVILGDGKKYQAAGFIGKAMEKYSEALVMNEDLIHEVKSLQYTAGLQMAELAAEADEFEEVQLAIYALEYAKVLVGGIGAGNEQLLKDLKNKMKALDEYKIRLNIEKRMGFARSEQALARSKRLEIGQTIPEVQELMGEPHEKILGYPGDNPVEQLWIYYVNRKTLQLSFQNYQLFKIEEI